MANLNVDQFKPTKREAILSIAPGAGFAILDDGSIQWDTSNINQPTTSQVDTELARLETEWNNNKYQRDRAPQYPNIGDQLDALYNDMISGKLNTTGEWAKSVKAVKDAYPKP